MHFVIGEKKGHMWTIQTEERERNLKYQQKSPPHKCVLCQACKRVHTKSLILGSVHLNL